MALGTRTGAGGLADVDAQLNKVTPYSTSNFRRGRVRKMSIQLTRDDRRRLTSIIENLRDFLTVRTRSVLIRDTLEDVPHSGRLLARLDLDGSPNIVASEVISSLVEFGQPVPGKEALGIFLNRLLERLGESDESAFIQGLFERYPLDRPIVTNRPIPLDEWRDRRKVGSLQEKVTVQTPSRREVTDAENDIFISYATDDRERLRPLVDVLKANSWSVFWDEETPAGYRWRNHIFENLRTSRCVIVAWSKKSISSDYVREEAEDAKKRGILLPVCIDRVEPPFGFKELQVHDLTGWNGAEDWQSFQRLVRRIAEIFS